MFVVFKVSVCINDINDEPPVFPGVPPDCLDISEDSTAGQLVINVAAHDPDLNPVLTYSFTVLPDDPGTYIYVNIPSPH